jgi:hypothetical protein
MSYFSADQSGFGPVANAATYGTLLSQQSESDGEVEVPTSNIGPVASGEAYGKMLASQPKPTMSTTTKVVAGLAGLMALYLAMK